MQEISLAQFVQTKREHLGLSASGLAKKCNLDLAFIEEIESGQELLLPTTLRQNLAKGLKCNPGEIKELEKKFDNEFVSEEIIEYLKERILDGEEQLVCPKCKSLLITRIAKLYDLEDNLMLHPKGRCSKCVFQIR
jgi:transcriptional regulator with XRE-family HTH domain